MLKAGKTGSLAAKQLWLSHGEETADLTQGKEALAVEV